MFGSKLLYKFKSLTLRHHYFIIDQGPSNQHVTITKKETNIKSVNSRTSANIANESSKSNSKHQNLNVYVDTIVLSSKDENRLKTNGKVKSLDQVRL